MRPARLVLPDRPSLRVARVQHRKVVQVRGSARRARVVRWQAAGLPHTTAAGFQRPPRPGQATLLAAQLPAQGGGGISEYQVPTAGSYPEGVAVTPDPNSPDGDAWFAENSGNKIGEVTPAGVFTEYPVPSQPYDSGLLQGIAADPGGNLWFTTYSYIGRMTPSGSFAFFPITRYNYAYDITPGPDGNMWFTEAGGMVGYVTPAGAVTEFPVGAGIDPRYITGLGGSVWFTATGSGGANYVYQLTAGGSLTQYPLPSGWILGDITAAPDGELWFASNSFALTAMTTSGTYTTYTWPAVYPNGYSPQYLRPDATGALVFGNFYGGAIGRMTTGGAVSFTSVPSGNSAMGLGVAPDGTIWFSEPSGNAIGVLPAGAGQFPASVPAAQTYGCACAGPAYTAQPQAFAGDGVNTATGAYSGSFADAQLPGPGAAFGLDLAYTSLDAASGPLGPGWTDSYNASLSFDPAGNATFTSGDGQQMQFASSGGSYTPAPGVYATLAAVTGGYQLTAPDGTLLNFSPAGQLASVTDRSGTGVTLAYSGGQLASATDAGGRTVAFGYNPAGLLASLTLPDGSSVGYGYNSAGQLASVTDPRQGVTQYGYTPAGQLATITDPDQHVVLANAYDPSTGRISSQTNGDGKTTAFSWNAQTQVETVTDPAGGTWAYGYYGNVLLWQDAPDGATTYHSYDGNLDLTQVTDPEGNRTEMTYDSAGNMLSMTSPAPYYYTQSWTYNTMNEVLTATDSRVQPTTCTYSPAGLLTSVTGPDQNQATFTYYPDGQLHTATNPDQQTTSYTYDAHDNLATILAPAATNPTSYGYDLNGRVTSVTDPLHKTTTYSYDAGGNLTSTTDPLTNTTRYTYDADGHLTGTTSPDGYLTGYGYDNAGNLTSTTDPLGNTTRYAYNSDGQLATATDAETNPTSYTYDSLGELTKITRPDGFSYFYDYTVDGQLWNYAADDYFTWYAYDSLGRITSITNPLGNTTSYGYDADGNPTASTSPDGLVTSYGYDPASRLTSVSYSDGTTPGLSYTYYPAGERKSMTDGTGTSSYHYTPAGQLATAADGAGNTIGYAYNADGNPTSLTYPNGKAVTDTYNAGQQLTGVTDWNQNTTSFGYDGDGNLTAEAYPNGDTASYAYNHDDQPTAITDTNAAGTTLASFAYTRGGNQELTSAATSGTAISAPAATYTYTSLGQLTGDGTSTYGYNFAEDLTRINAGTQGFANNQQIIDATTSGNNITDFAFNTRGDRTAATTSSGVTIASYGYNQANQLTSSTPAAGPATTYAYDGTGLRTSKTTSGTTTSYTWDTTAAVPLMLTDGTTSYLYGPGGLPVESTGTTGTPTYYLHDQLGSTRLLTDPAGAVTATYGYDPWGNTTSHTGTATTPLQYAGQYQDSETGFYYLQNRYYDPATAQFLTADPRLSLTGSAYGYAADNPATLTDPTGLGPVGGGSGGVQCTPQNANTPACSGSNPCPCSGSQPSAGGGFWGWVSHTALPWVANVTGVSNAYNCITDPSWGQCAQAVLKGGLDVLTVASGGTDAGAEVVVEDVVGDIGDTATTAAEDGLNVEGANFAQRTFSSTFRGGSLAGRSIGDVAGDLGSGALTPKDVPVGMIVREGNSLILNTRSAQALMQAGIPRSAWSVIDQTGDPFFEELLTGQLTRNGLDSSGFPYPTPSGG